MGEAYLGLRPVRVPGHVGERLLDDAVRGTVHGLRQRAGGLVGVPDRDGDRDARRPGALHEFVQPVQARALRHHIRTQDLQRRAQLTHRLAARLLDGQQRGGHLVTALAREMHGNARLELDDRDGVGEGVVQLAGDPQPFLARPAQRGLLTRAFGLACPLLRLPQIRLPVLVDEPGDTRREEPADQQRGPFHDVVGARVDGEEHDEEDRARRDAQRPAPAARRRVDGGEDREGHPGARLPVQDVREHAERRHDEHGDRRAPVRGQCQGAGRDQRDVERAGAGVLRDDGREQHHAAGQGRESRVQQPRAPAGRRALRFAPHGGTVASARRAARRPRRLLAHYSPRSSRRRVRPGGRRPECHRRYDAPGPGPRRPSAP